MADHVGDRPEDWEASGAALVPSAAAGRIPTAPDLGRVQVVVCLGDAFDDCEAEADTCVRCAHRLAWGVPRGVFPWP